MPGREAVLKKCAKITYLVNDRVHIEGHVLLFLKASDFIINIFIAITEKIYLLLCLNVLWSSLLYLYFVLLFDEFHFLVDFHMSRFVKIFFNSLDRKLHYIIPDYLSNGNIHLPSSSKGLINQFLLCSHFS